MFSLPVALLATIQKKESLYPTSSSSELIDHYVSYSHTVAEGKLPEINSQYKVFRTGTAPGTFRQQNEHKDAETIKLCQVCEEQGHFARNCLNKDKTGQMKSHRAPVVQAVTTEGGNLTMEERVKERKKANEMRSTTLEKAGYNKKGITCFACLGAHFKSKCPVYDSGFKLSQSLCYVDRKPHGFHTSAECKGKIDRQQPRTDKTRLRTWRVRKM